MKKNDNSDNQFPNLPIYMSIGISIGVAIGAAMDNLPLWMCLGLSIGVGLGAVIDSRNHTKNIEEEQKKD